MYKSIGLLEKFSWLRHNNVPIKLKKKKKTKKKQKQNRLSSPHPKRVHNFLDCNKSNVCFLSKAST